MTYQNVTFPSKTIFKAYLVTYWFKVTLHKSMCVRDHDFDL